MTALSSPVLLHLLGAFICGTCILVVGAQNPIHSLLLLIIVFVRGTLLLFTLQREYFAVLFLIVYVGAIVVLFLFVIRRLEIKIINTARRFRDLFSYRHLAIALLLFEVFVFSSSEAFDLTGFLSSTEVSTFTETNTYTDWGKLLHRTDSLRGLGGLLYTEGGISLLLAALLLTLSIIGAVGVTLTPVAAVTPTTDLEARVPANVSAPRRIKIQEGEHQARRHPTLLSNTFRSYNSN